MQKQNRRKFLATAAALAAVPAIFGQPDQKNKKEPMIHHVFFWLKNPGSQTDRQQLIEGLKTLSAIKEVKKLLIGIPAATEQRGVVDNSYDVSELMHFDKLDDQSAYQVHPIHKAFVEKYSHLWEKVVVYDMQIV
jgi:hypothetical protein